MASSDQLTKSISQASTSTSTDITALKVEGATLNDDTTTEGGYEVRQYTVTSNKNLSPVQIKDVTNSSTEDLGMEVSNNLINNSSSNPNNSIESPPLLGITNSAENTSISFSHELVPTTIPAAKDSSDTCSSSPQPSVQLCSLQSSKTSTDSSNTFKGAQLLAQLLVPPTNTASKDGSVSCSSTSPSQSTVQICSSQTSTTTAVSSAVSSNTITGPQLSPQKSVNLSVALNKTPLTVPLEQNFRWGWKQVNTLINKVSDHFEEFYDHSVRKKDVWKSIAASMCQEGYSCTSGDCDKKWRNLKHTYIKVLRKQIKGDTDHRFEHFSSLHDLLGKEIDPLGMREQAISDWQEQAIEEHSPEHNGSPTEEDGLQWNNKSVNRLLDLIHEQSHLLSSESANCAWKRISQRMNEEKSTSHIFSIANCRNKWLSLRRDFNDYQQQATVSGSVPLWPFFTRVRVVLSSLNKYGGKNMSSYCEEVIAQNHRTGSVLERLEEINKKISVKERLAKLEENVEVSQKIEEARAQTNNLLQQVLSELRSITDSIEAENHHRQVFKQTTNPATHMSANGESHQHQQQQQQQQLQQQQQHQQQPQNNNNQPGIIIVEAYQDELT